MNLTKLKELCEKATPGPWIFNASLYTSSRLWIEPCEKATPGPCIFNASLYTSSRLWIEPKDCGLILKSEENELAGQMKEITEFIAQARTALPILIEVVEKQREAIYEACNLEAYIESEDGEYWVKSFNQRVKECDELLKELEE